MPLSVAVDIFVLPIGIEEPSIREPGENEPSDDSMFLTDQAEIFGLLSSVFAARPRNCDSKAFFDTAKIYRSSFRADWAKLQPVLLDRYSVSGTHRSDNIATALASAQR